MRKKPREKKIINNKIIKRLQKLSLVYLNPKVFFQIILKLSWAKNGFAFRRSRVWCLPEPLSPASPILPCAVNGRNLKVVLQDNPTRASFQSENIPDISSGCE